MNVVQMLNQEPELQVSFDDFWGMYPRRAAKKDARRAWEKIPEKTHTVILVALFEWRRIWLDRNEIEFIPHPATWLNGERWEDDFPPHHRPYTAKTAAVEAVKETQQDRKPIPQHVLEALKRLREK